MRVLLAMLKLNGAGEVKTLVHEQYLYLFYNLVWGRIPKAIRVNNLLLINIDAEFAKSAFNLFYLDVVFFTQLSCHTGS